MPTRERVCELTCPACTVDESKNVRRHFNQTSVRRSVKWTTAADEFDENVRVLVSLFIRES